MSDIDEIPIEHQETNQERSHTLSEGITMEDIEKLIGDIKSLSDEGSYVEYDACIKFKIHTVDFSWWHPRQPSNMITFIDTDDSDSRGVVYGKYILWNLDIYGNAYRWLSDVVSLYREKPYAYILGRVADTYFTSWREGDEPSKDEVNADPLRYVNYGKSEIPVKRLCKSVISCIIREYARSLI